MTANATPRIAYLLGALAVLALAGCGGSKAPTTTTTATTTAAPGTDGPRLGFGYDHSAALGFTDHGVVQRKGSVNVLDVEFRSGGKRIQGYLVEPAGTRRRPGVVLVHGSGGDRTELLGAAVGLAERGLVALTITTPSTADPLPQPSTIGELLSGSKLTVVRDVVAIRRAGDVLASLPIVDPQRLGYLGWSAGAKTGTFVAASDKRFRALALLSAGADTLNAFVASAPAADRTRVRAALGSVDPIRYVALARPGSLLLEDGTQDEIVPHAALENIVRAAPHGTLVRWYPTGHALNDKAYRDAFAWLARKLDA